MTDNDDRGRARASEGHGGAIGTGTERAAYLPPTLTPLGSLAELTHGGTAGPSDGFGGAGTTGSLP